LIEGREIPLGDEVSAWRAEVDRWKGEALRERRTCEDLHAKLAELEGRAMYWRSEASGLQRGQGEHAAELAGLEGEVRKWRSMATGLRVKVEELDEFDGDDIDDEEEMQEILDRINASANTDFDFLSDAVARADKPARSHHRWSSGKPRLCSGYRQPDAHHNVLHT
jgi:chromosome segregation ATPase